MGYRADCVNVIPQLFSDTNEGMLVRDQVRRLVRREHKHGTLDVWWDRAAYSVREKYGWSEDQQGYAEYLRDSMSWPEDKVRDAVQELVEKEPERVADYQRFLFREAGDWQNMPADSVKFRQEVARRVVSFLYETH